MIRNWAELGRCWILWIVLVDSLSLSVLAQSNGTILREGFDLQRCGVPRIKNLRSRITEGELAVEGHWPWHGGLFHLNEYQCGCTLINELFVLTASHCVYNSATGYKLSERILRIKLGMYRLSANDTERTQVYTVRSIISHTKYMTSSHKHDVALVRLNGTVQFTDYIQPVCLDLTESIWVEHLADAEIPIVRYTDCVEQDPSTYGPLIYSGMYCAGILNGTSPCNGDSGGGMYIFRDNRWFLRGVVSFASIRAGTNFCDSFSYVVFMNVPYYTKWISTEVEAARESVRLEAETSTPKTNVSSRWDSDLTENDASLEETFFPVARMDTEGENSSPLPRRTARCGQNVTLSCVRPSNSILTYRRDVRWYKSVNGRREFLASKALLRLQPVRSHDAGEYWCTTTARSGRLLESGILLEVSDVPLRFRQNGATKSYTSYGVPTRTGFSLTQFSFEMTFKTTESDGLLFHKPTLPDLESWSYSLLLERSRLTFRMVPPGQSEKVFRTVRLNLEPDRWMTVLISCYDGHGFLALDGQYLLGFEGHLLQHRLDRFYIANAPELPNAVPGLSGCVSRVAVNEQELRLLEDASEKVGVELCDDCPTGECRDADGTGCPMEQISCINYACSDGRCDRSDAFSPERTCDFQPGTYADGLRLQQNSYASYRSFLSTALTVELQFRLHSLQDGIVLHTAEHRRGYGKFITVLFKAGRIELRFTTDAHLTTTFMESEVPLAVGRWYLLRAGFANGYVYLQVDGERKVERSVAGKLVSPERQLVVFVGGVRWKGFINRHRDVWKGLDGCIRELKLSGLPVDMVDDMVESANFAVQLQNLSWQMGRLTKVSAFRVVRRSIKGNRRMDQRH
ncbi:AGAP005072-PA-like protein [Anopheles sinensis]|uniref:AGAP005072-PA-like protein n=1 Tax=Anopheles sinensis TaxID=74873 RepID=A0A084WJE9_ANOSI|nr:AGAP005072-PA-like protein [Anopheles sinensis]